MVRGVLVELGLRLPKLQPCCFYSARVGNHRVNKWLFYDQQLQSLTLLGRQGTGPAGPQGSIDTGDIIYAADKSRPR